jgi:hypothetical protein
LRSASKRRSVYTGRAAPELESILEQLLKLLEEINELLVGGYGSKTDE